MTIYRARSLDEAESLIKDREAFVMGTRGNVHAYPGWNGARGFLPDNEVTDGLRSAIYVVYSYGTPIAWVTEDDVKVIPDVGFSATTSQHQYMVAAAWGVDFRPARGRTVVEAGGGPRRGGVDG